MDMGDDGLPHGYDNVVYIGGQLPCCMLQFALGNHQLTVSISIVRTSERLSSLYRPGVSNAISYMLLLLLMYEKPCSPLPPMTPTTEQHVRARNCDWLSLGRSGTRGMRRDEGAGMMEDLPTILDAAICISLLDGMFGLIALCREAHIVTLCIAAGSSFDQPIFQVWMPVLVDACISGSVQSELWRDRSHQVHAVKPIT